MRRSLRHSDRDVDLRPKSFDVLRCLVEKAGELVTKDELIESVWPNVVVTDESLTRCVSDVRLALGDSDQRIVKTIPRRGYLLAAPVSRAAPYESFLPAADLAGRAPLDRPMTGKTSRAASGVWLRALGHWRLLSALVSAVMLLAAIGTSTWFWNQSSGLPLPGRPSIAVLPFANLSGDPQQDYFSDGIAEDLTTGLSKFADLFTIAHDSAFKYKGRHIDVKQIGRELGVRYVLHGSTRRDPERVRITAQLVEAASGVQLWAERYDGNLSGLFAVQDEITHKIVVTLVARISKSELDRALRTPPEAPAAHDYYLRGNALMQDIPPTDAERRLLPLGRSMSKPSPPIHATRRRHKALRIPIFAPGSIRLLTIRLAANLSSRPSSTGRNLSRKGLSNWTRRSQKHMPHLGGFCTGRIIRKKAQRNLSAPSSSIRTSSMRALVPCLC